MLTCWCARERVIKKSRMPLNCPFWTTGRRVMHLVCVSMCMHEAFEVLSDIQMSGCWIYSLDLPWKLELETQIWQPSGYRWNLKPESWKKKSLGRNYSYRREEVWNPTFGDEEQGHNQVQESENELPLKTEGDREGQKPNTKCVSKKRWVTRSNAAKTVPRLRLRLDSHTWGRNSSLRGRILKCSFSEWSSEGNSWHMLKK